MNLRENTIEKLKKEYLKYKGINSLLATEKQARKILEKYFEDINIHHVDVEKCYLIYDKYKIALDFNGKVNNVNFVGLESYNINIILSKKLQKDIVSYETVSKNYDVQGHHEPFLFFTKIFKGFNIAFFGESYNREIGIIFYKKIEDYYLKIKIGKD